jgi:hypothetical protein
MVVGNSVGWYLADALKAQHTSHPDVVLNFAGPTCFFPHDIVGERVPKLGNTVETLKKDPCDIFWWLALPQFRPNVVLFLFAAADPYDVRVQNAWLRPCSPTWTAMERRALRNAVAAASAHGARVVLATAAYDRIPDFHDDHAADCDNRVRREVAKATRTQLIDLFAHVCPHGACHNVENGVTLRPDGLHFRGAGALLIARWLIRKLHL